MTLANRIKKLEEKMPSRKQHWIWMDEEDSKEEKIADYCREHNISDAERERIDWNFIVFVAYQATETPDQAGAEQ